MPNQQNTIEAQALDAASTPRGGAAGIGAAKRAQEPAPAPRNQTMEDLGYTRADPFNPAESAQYQAFLRRQGASAASARAAIAKRMAALQQQQDRRLEDLQIQQDRGVRGIRTDFESRGVARGGRSQLAQSEYAGDVERTRSRFLADLAEQRAELEASSKRIGSGGGAARQRMLESLKRQYELGLAEMGYYVGPAPQPVGRASSSRFQ